MIRAVLPDLKIAVIVGYVMVLRTIRGGCVGDCVGWLCKGCGLIEAETRDRRLMYRIEQRRYLRSYVLAMSELR